MVKTCGVLCTGILVIVIFVPIFPPYWFIPVPIGLVLMLVGICMWCGIYTVNPNEAYLLTLWGEYKGTVKKNG